MDELNELNELGEPNEPHSIKMEGLHVVFRPNFYNPIKSNEILDQLKNLRASNSCRKQMIFRNDITQEWPSFLREVRDELQQFLIDNHILSLETKEQINHASINVYKDGHDHIGPRSYDEKNLSLISDSNGNKESIILFLSFGATRDLVFHNKINSTITYKLPLHHGDLIIMRGETQKKWKHSIPKRLKVKNCQINLTFQFVRQTVL
jgi:alkylated DNA repair dioxygenase AlkB